MRLPLQIAVVGSGIGAQHLQGYQEFSDLFDVKILCDIDRECAASVSEKFGIAEIGTRFDAVCRRPDIDVIDICTPPHLHFEQIKRALASGKHVICEKPLVGRCPGGVGSHCRHLLLKQIQHARPLSDRPKSPSIQYTLTPGTGTAMT